MSKLRRFSSLLLALTLSPAVGAALQVRLELPDLTVVPISSDKRYGMRLATHGRHFWQMTTRPGSDDYLRYRRDPGSGWTFKAESSLLDESGAVSVDASESLLIRSVGNEVIVAHYTNAGSFSTQTTLASTASLAIAVDGNVAAYGLAGLTGGTIYPYEWDGLQWNFLGAVTRAGTLSGFGAAGLALEGDYLFVGEPYYDGSNQTGKVYIYRRDRSQTICGQPYCPTDPAFFAPDQEADNLYGAAIAADGEWLAVGAPRDDFVRISPFQIRSDAGIVYLYRFNGRQYAFEGGIRSELFEAGDRFGASVDLWNRSLVVGSPFDDIPAEFPRTDMGSAHVFLYDGATWVEKSFLRSAVLGFGDQAGTDVSVGIFGAQVGAPYSDEGANDGGAIYFFDDALWLFRDGFESGDDSAWSP